MDLGNAYASMGEYDNAVDAFSKALLLIQTMAKFYLISVVYIYCKKD